MKALKSILCLVLMLALIAGIALSGHAAGNQICGSLTTFGDTSGVTHLYLTSDVNSDALYEQFVDGTQTSYALTGIPNGSYLLNVEKDGHVTRTYPVTVSGSDIQLDVKICLIGDVNGNGTINMADVSSAYAHIRQNKLITDSYKLACADFNNNETLNLADVSSIYAVAKGTYRPAPKAVTLSIWAPAEDQYEPDSWLLKMEKDFQEKHPEYQITWKNKCCNEGDPAWLIQQDPSSAADVYMYACDQIHTLVDLGVLMELSGEYLDQVLTDNSQTMVNTVTYTDGGVYGFPISNVTWFMYYNKDIFSEEDIKSLDTMLSKGKVSFPWGSAWYTASLFLANGGTIFGDKGIDASAGIQFGRQNGGYEAARKMIQLVNNPNMVNDFSGAGCEGFREGSVGAFFSGSWDYPYLYDALGDKLGVAALPTVEINGAQKQMKSFATSKAVAVNPNASNLELATDFAAYLATPEAQKARYDYRGVIPASTSLNHDPDILQNPVALAEINTIANTAVLQPFLPEMEKFWNPVGNFGWNVVTGQINSSNYQNYVDQMMYAMNGKMPD